MLTEDHHRSRIQSAVESISAAPVAVPGHITDSWMRCMRDYHLDPAVVSDPYIVERVELQERQHKLSHVLGAAKAEMTNLFQQIAGSGYAIMLTDADGVLMNYFGDLGFTHAASKTGMTPGAVWSERYQGTNGMGTALLEKRPTMVQQYDHFLFRNTGLTCAAAPIFDTGGEVLAVLDASGETHLAPKHVLDLVNMSVHTIENRIFLKSFEGRRFMHFHSRPEFVATVNAGILALDEDDRIMAATRHALLQLGVKPGELVGHALEEFFNVSFESLSRETGKLARPVAPVFDARFGRRFYAYAASACRGAAAPCGKAAPAAADCDAERACRTPLQQLQYGPDAEMSRNIDAASRILDRDVPILLCGETGTGKEMFAKALHQTSQRAAQPFVAINCASIPESLIESELFGYKSGAFTGASKEGQRGKIFQANGGTLFLDEIGDMPFALQARLLRVLEEREVAPLGGETPVRIDIRLISATHCDLLDKIDRKEFREDLYYRLQGLTLTMPPLRERSDRRQLIQHLLKREQTDCGELSMTPELMDALDQYRWPGNMRQLRNVLRTMVALRRADLLTVADLPADIARCRQAQPALAPAPEVRDGHECMLNPLKSAEREALLQVLKRARWNISTVARELGVGRNTLYRKLERLNIDLSDGKKLPGPAGDLQG